MRCFGAECSETTLELSPLTAQTFELVPSTFNELAAAEWEDATDDEGAGEEAQPATLPAEHFFIGGKSPSNISSPSNLDIPIELTQSPPPIMAESVDPWTKTDPWCGSCDKNGPEFLTPAPTAAAGSGVAPMLRKPFHYCGTHVQTTAGPVLLSESKKAVAPHPSSNLTRTATSISTTELPPSTEFMPTVPSLQEQVREQNAMIRLQMASLKIEAAQTKLTAAASSIEPTPKQSSSPAISRMPPVRLPWQVDPPPGLITVISSKPTSVVSGEGSAPATGEPARLLAVPVDQIQGEEAEPKRGVGRAQVA